MRWLIARLCFFPSLAWNLAFARLDARRRWWDRVDEHVVIGALPFRSDIPALHAEGVRAVVNTCEEYAGPTDTYAKLGIDQLRIPTIDFTPPALEQVEEAVAYMRERAARGESVLVHCKAGRGRSATVVLCWLIDRNGVPPEKAMALLTARRPHVLPEVARREVVRAFAAKRGLRDD